VLQWCLNREPIRTHGNISTVTPNWGKNHDFRLISGFGIGDCWTVEYCQYFERGVRL